MSVRSARMFEGAALAGFVLLALSAVPDASARMRCSCGGAPDNQLTVTADRDALGELTRAGEITKSGQEIFVTEFGNFLRRCRGGVATVLNTDTIKVVPHGFVDLVDVLLGRGPFAPGGHRRARGRPRSRSNSSSGSLLLSRKLAARGVPMSSTGAPDPVIIPVST
jgi:hypothetical protein